MRRPKAFVPEPEDVLILPPVPRDRCPTDCPLDMFSSRMCQFCGQIALDYHADSEGHLRRAGISLEDALPLRPQNIGLVHYID